MSEKGNTGSFFTGLLIGAVIGVAVGILFAPQSGKETRAVLKDKAVKAKEKAGELVQKVKQISSDLKTKYQAEE